MSGRRSYSSAATPSSPSPSPSFSSPSPCPWSSPSALAPGPSSWSWSSPPAPAPSSCPWSSPSAPSSWSSPPAPASSSSSSSWSSPSTPAAVPVPASSSASSVDELLASMASTSINEVENERLPVKAYVFVSIDLEATTHEYNCFANGKVYPRSTPTQIGISVLRATGDNAALYAKDPCSEAGTEFRHIFIKEFKKYRTRVGKLKQGEKVAFQYGRTEFHELAKVNGLIKKLIEEESKYGQVVLVGHAIQNDQAFLEKAGIDAFDRFFPDAIDTQAIHLEPGSKNGRSLLNLVWGYDPSVQPGWEHNAGNDAAWTLWVLANKFPDLLRVSDSGEEMIIDSYKKLRFPSRMSRQSRLYEDQDDIEESGGWGIENWKTPSAWDS
ncbi:hypothetical protein sscle_05g042760 [Sclerotinia sclerotiorum 1980 UF-70]|uniref:Gfd2/YDR514C-like C-terminal domain-containing protein n=1 Tax=Sclerotinia sclerotiorum (strain ATCC 18683 / 1980 / Ss-1) TaxID=665079 RepID=A0A1D9Q3N0_SCLS1|nr:hypothetical protein sscle_05g042760 [Sclerotinia sclerotiorum 1980 UF-70]